MRKIVIIALAISSLKVSAQTNTFPSSGNVGIGTTSPTASSLLEMKSTSKGLLVPRMTQAQRDAITSPSEGLMVYQTDGTPGFYYVYSGEWTALKGANKSLSNLTSPTYLKVNLLPNTTNSVDIGSSTKLWRSAYFSNDILINGNTVGNGASNADGCTAFGIQSLYNNTTNGTSNTAIGRTALYANTSGYGNIAIGDRALNHNNGNENVAMGEISLFSNTSGYYNTAIGTSALFGNTTGYYNTAVGCYTFLSNQTGIQNSALGYHTLANTTNSWGNTALGYQAGYAYDNGYYNCFIGSETDVNAAGLYNVVALGHGTLCTASSQVRVGNSATTSIGGFVDWSNISDGRVKKNIKQNVPGLAFINKLQPVTYNLDLDAADKITQAPQRKDSTGKIIQLSAIETNARKAKEQIIYTGFVAQDVEKAAKNLNYDFSGVDVAKNDKDLYGLRYADFVVPLVKGEQDLSKQNDSLKSVVNSLQNQINELKAMIITSVNGQQFTVISSASLSQNIPNPFNSSTSISYVLPQTYSSAEIIITDNKGVTLKKISLNTKGKGNVNIDAATLASGAYHYSLYVDGKMIDSKQMISSSR